LPQGQFSFCDFNLASVQSLLGQSPASAYLHAYLEALGAKGVIVEHHYIDRHYLDDYTNYYARSFDAPRAFCARLHFFSIAAPQANALFDNAYASLEVRDAAEKQLQGAYLGFVVVRPLRGALIGRTVLKTYPVDGRRHYEVVRPYRVHIAGIHLVVEGLAYQQQDRGAAVCASTALVLAYLGHSTLGPRPLAIT
jgi:hypothetical protein